MICPRCQAEFALEQSVCPECGIRIVRNVSGVMKTSAVLISAHGEQGFYRSVEEVPEPLRTQLIETTSSQNSGVIVIADKAGKEQLTQVLAQREAASEIAQPRATKIAPVDEETLPALPAPQSLSKTAFPKWVAWTAFFLILLTAILAFALFQYR